MPKLKVFRTPIGFHDAYVAAPTKKAAIEAWGTDKAIFQRGEAEEVTNPELMADPLLSPGVVVKKLRGTAAEQIEALGSDEPARAKARAKSAKPDRKANRPAKLKPRPGRDALEKAEAALEAAEARHHEERREIARQETNLADEKRKTLERHEDEADRLTDARDRAKESYDNAMARWRGL